MNTKIWTSTIIDIQEAALCLNKGDVVAFPTETVYGLGANALNEGALQKIFIAKGRPQDNPLIVHIACVASLSSLVKTIPPSAQKLIDAFWPGALTLIFKKQDCVSSLVSAGLDTIAIRMPNHPIAQSLLTQAGIPLAAPSANLSGKPSCTQMQHVLQDMKGKIAGIIDGGNSVIGLESTVVDCTVYPVVILRPGGITTEQIREVVDVQGFTATDMTGETPKAPGMKYRHYAPKAAFVIVPHDKEILQQAIATEQKHGKKVGVMVTDDFAFVSADYCVLLGDRENLEIAASKIFLALRAFDENCVDIIFATEFPKTGIGEAIMNRLEKASLQS
ncbi:MAG: L-threonylcarbamoyladenylate synthase [Treponemataceae bacterium]